MISSLSRDELYYRHQLSHEQIDEILGEKKAVSFPEAKAQHLLKLNTFLAISDLFFREGIPFIPQKGPVLSFRIYGDPLVRTYNDLDFLIDSERIPEAFRLLSKGGFRASSYEFPEEECRRALLMRHVNELYLWNPDLETGIELHWDLTGVMLPGQAGQSGIIEENSTVLGFEGRDYRVLNQELELLFLVIHGSLHGWNRLKWLLDVRELLRKYDTDEVRFEGLVRQFNARRPVAVCNELLKIYFPGTKLLPSACRAPAGMVRFALRQIGKPDRPKEMGGFLGFFINSWRAFPGTGYRFDLLKRNLFATDLASVPWIPCSAIGFYFLSPFRKLSRGFRR